VAAPLSITFNNLTKSTTFQRCKEDWAEAILDENVQLPDTSMPAYDTQVMSVDNSLFFGAGASYFSCCWFDPSTSTRIGVQISDSGQVAEMGWAPTWQYMQDNGPADADVTWQDSGDDPASPKGWGASSPFKMNGSPTANKETLTIIVDINDA
jgi:hypothetical protein